MNRYSTRAESLFGDLIVRLLDPYATIGPSLRGRIGTAVVRLLDSAMIIEDPRLPFRPLASVSVRHLVQEAPVAPAIESALQEIRRDGFAPHFHHFIGLLGAIMINANGNPAQREAVAAWTANGLTGAFMMTDGGGPSLTQWASVAQIEDKLHWLRIDKIWVTAADRFGFAIVMAANSRRMAPTAYLIDPEACKSLFRTAQGPPFLDGTVQLGAVRGEVHVKDEDVLRQGGPLGVAQFLCQARPRFATAVIAHVHWLSAQGRASRSHPAIADLLTVGEASTAIRQQMAVTRHSIDEVLALKFALNETLASLACEDPLLSAADQRDLLAFTKMEGSSYRCLFEIYGRCRALRHG